MVCFCVSAFTQESQVRCRLHDDTNTTQVRSSPQNEPNDDEVEEDETFL